MIGLCLLIAALGFAPMQGVVGAAPGHGLVSELLGPRQGEIIHVDSFKVDRGTTVVLSTTTCIVSSGDIDVEGDFVGEPTTESGPGATVALISVDGDIRVLGLVKSADGSSSAEQHGIGSLQSRPGGDGGSVLMLAPHGHISVSGRLEVGNGGRAGDVSAWASGPFDIARGGPGGTGGNLITSGLTVDIPAASVSGARGGMGGASKLFTSWLTTRAIGGDAGQIGRWYNLPPSFGSEVVRLVATTCGTPLPVASLGVPMDDVCPPGTDGAEAISVATGTGSNGDNGNAGSNSLLSGGNGGAGESAGNAPDTGDANAGNGGAGCPGGKGGRAVTDAVNSTGGNGGRGGDGGCGQLLNGGVGGAGGRGGQGGESGHARGGHGGTGFDNTAGGDGGDGTSFAGNGGNGGDGGRGGNTGLLVPGIGGAPGAAGVMGTPGLETRGGQGGAGNPEGRDGNADTRNGNPGVAGAGGQIGRILQICPV